MARGTSGSDWPELRNRSSALQRPLTCPGRRTWGLLATTLHTYNRSLPVTGQSKPNRLKIRKSPPHQHLLGLTATRLLTGSSFTRHVRAANLTSSAAAIRLQSDEVRPDPLERPRAIRRSRGRGRRHGPKEAAYLASVIAFAEESGITELSIRKPGVNGPVSFGLEAPVEGNGLAGLFASDLSDYFEAR